MHEIVREKLTHEADEQQDCKHVKTVFIFGDV